MQVPSDVLTAHVVEGPHLLHITAFNDVLHVQVPMQWLSHAAMHK